jgi:hypothetical protein
MEKRLSEEFQLTSKDNNHHEVVIAREILSKTGNDPLRKNEHRLQKVSPT